MTIFFFYMLPILPNEYHIIRMALNLKTKNTMTEKINIRTIYVNTAATSSVQWNGKPQPYDDQLNNKNSEIKNQKANEYSQLKDRQYHTYHMYENNNQSIHGVVQEMEINHPESKLPIVLSSTKTSNRQFKIGIGILAANCCLLVVALIYVIVIPSTRSPCESRGCLNNGICNVVDGNIECECLQGFGGSSCEVTPCDIKICEYGGECYLNDFEPKCSCRLGFGGENCTVTPCSSNPCLHAGECILGLNTSYYHCSCPAGFTGANCQETPCPSDPCHNNGMCSYTKNSNQYNCTCQIGFSGVNCEGITTNKGSPCEGRGCLNNGICDVVDGNMECECIQGFGGSRCEVTPCDFKICENGGECYLNDFQSKCSCRLGFSGENCSVTPCSSNPCLHSGECTLGLNTSDYHCSCPAGFAGTNCEDTPCAIDPCHNNGVCSYTTNSNRYNCTCQRGFSGVNCQVTPCSSAPCENNGICNVIGFTYNCLCFDGFVNQNCTDYMCNAEDSDDVNCILEQDQISDNTDWIRRSGSTSTPLTGPSKAAEGSYYFYFEGNNATGSTARLISRSMKTGYTKCLSFNYHMYGSTMGLLYVYGDRSVYWTRSGNHNNVWYFQTITIQSTVTKITFHAQRGSNIYSDIAIDNITITTI